MEAQRRARHYNNLEIPFLEGSVRIINTIEGTQTLSAIPISATSIPFALSRINGPNSGIVVTSAWR